MIKFIQRHGSFFYPWALIGTGMNLLSPHGAAWTDRLSFFIVAVFPAVLVTTLAAARREDIAARAVAARRRSMARWISFDIWQKSHQHPDLIRADDPGHDWVRLLLAPSGTVIKHIAENEVMASELRQFRQRTADHALTLETLHNLGLTQDTIWIRINALAAALSEVDFNPKLVMDLVGLVEQSFAAAIPAPANLQQEPS